MAGGTKPAAEVPIDVPLVRSLIRGQFPHLSRLAVRAVASAGWDNVIYRLGAELGVRLPRRRIGADQTEKEHQWLPVLGPQLPLAVPFPVGKGMPGEGYPWHWTVSPWLPGEVAALAPVADLSQTAMSLAQFVRALQAIDPAARSVSFVAGLLLPAIRSAELQLRRCEIVSMSGLYWRYGTLLSRNRCGRGRLYGCTVIFTQRTCWSTMESLPR